MAWFLFLGSLPAAFAGFLAKDLAETLLRNPIIMVVTLSAFGLLLWVADRFLQRSERSELDAGKALAIGIAVHCDGCVAYHTRAAHKLGATREQVAETVALALYMGGGPAAVYGADAIRAYDEFAGATGG